MRLFKLAFRRIVPGKRLYQLVSWLFGIFVELLYLSSQVEDEPGVAPGVVRRLDGLVVPLHHPLGLGKRAVLLGDERRRYEEDFRAALLGFAAEFPGFGGLYAVGVEDDEPVEVPQAFLGYLDVRAADGEVLAEDEAALRHAVFHVQDRRVERVVAGDPREVVE